MFRDIIVAKTGRKALIPEMMRLLNIGKNTAGEKLNGKRKFRSDEIEKCRVEYGMTNEQVVDVFIREVK